MQNSAQIQAAIEVCQLIFEKKATPADKLLRTYFRDRRYIGSKDKKAISNHIYRLLRRVPRYQRVIGENARLFMLMLLRDEEKMSLSELNLLFSGGTYAPSELTKEEVRHLKSSNDFSMSEKLALPESLYNYFTESMSQEQCDNLAQAYLTEASFDLRVNTIKSTREAVLAVLQGEGFDVTPTPYSPIGIRFDGRKSMDGHSLFKDGVVEVQDEGSQLISLACEVSSKMTVLDYCAGAGGKTLALAAEMKNKGQLFACDIHAWRLKRARERLTRADIHNVRFYEADDSKFLKRHQTFFDRVLVDAPCSGTGTWRRNPDMKFKTTPADIEELQALQRSILSKVAPLVKSNGWLIYATCSVFRRENQDQVAWFLENFLDFKLVSEEEKESINVNISEKTENGLTLNSDSLNVIEDTIAAISKKEPQKSKFYANLRNTLPKFDGCNDALGLQLLPHLHETDGFFMSILVKK